MTPDLSRRRYHIQNPRPGGSPFIGHKHALRKIKQGLAVFVDERTIRFTNDREEGARRAMSTAAWAQRQKARLIEKARQDRALDGLGLTTDLDQFSEEARGVPLVGPVEKLLYGKPLRSRRLTP
jgi:hypothetical protein